MRRHHVVLPIAALLTIVPLLIHGISCGQDLGFHMQSWMDAAQQFRHGAFFPRWAFSAAWEAGEPRFVFYPPLSWVLGALLTMVFSLNTAVFLYTWLALTAAGFAMHRLAAEFTSSGAALVAACMYLANPYMLLNAFYRCALAELLAAIWIPLIFLSILRRRPSVHGIALPLAFVWLTNAPSAVMGTYCLALLALLRVTVAWMQARRDRTPETTARSLALVSLGGIGLGLALPAFYLVPAAYERRFVQIAMAIIPNMRYQDNFLFRRTADAPHNAFNRTASWLAVTLLVATSVVLLGLFLSRRNRRPAPDGSRHRVARLSLPVILGALTVGILFMLLPASAPLWEHLPNLKFLQFPWRLLTILSSVLGLSLALLLARFRLSTRLALFAAPLASLGLGLAAGRYDRQACDPPDYAPFASRCFATDHGVPATDEYTPGDADNDVLRPNDPAFWLASDPNAQAPGTLPNPWDADPDYEGPVPLRDTQSERAPRHLSLNLAAPQILVLHLRNYPNWHLTRNHFESLPRLDRDDGLIAVALPAGPSTIDVSWRASLDEAVGCGLSAVALVVLGVVFRRSRKIVP